MNAYNSLNPNHVFIDYYTDEQSEGKKIPVIQKSLSFPSYLHSHILINFKQ